MFHVFLALRPLRRRSGAVGWCSEWVVRGSGGVLYSSKICDTEEHALALARAYIAKRPEMIDTTPDGRFPLDSVKRYR